VRGEQRVHDTQAGLGAHGGEHVGEAGEIDRGAFAGAPGRGGGRLDAGGAGRGSRGRRSFPHEMILQYRLDTIRHFY
jgi:hypothetical protein